MNKENMRSLTRSFYDAQKLRIMAGNRIVANIRVRMGQAPGKPTDEMDEEGKKLLETVALEYRRITDGLVQPTRRVLIAKITELESGVITDQFEFALAAYYMTLLDREHDLEVSIKEMVEQFPLWEQFLSKVKGCGPLMSAVILSELDPYKARHVSSFWKYAGLDVAEDGKGRSKRAEHLIDVEYVNKRGEKATKKSITYNPFLKAKLAGVLSGSFLRCASPYSEVYYNYKARLENRPDLAEARPIVRHRMALRYMMKMFLRDLWLTWREIEGLPVTADYATAKLGIVHGAEMVPAS
jgi:hypothetical protein